MSIYCTAFCLEDFPDDPDYGHLGLPYVYQGSHIKPAPDHPRGGYVDTGIIPSHIGGYCREFLRLGVGADDEGRDETVLLDRAQVKALRDHLTDWLEGRCHPDEETP